MRLLMRRSGVMLNPRMARFGPVSDRNKPCYFNGLPSLKFAEQQQDQQHDQDPPDQPHPGMAETIAIAAKTAGEAAQQENNQDDDQYRAKRHGGLLKAWPTSGENAPRPGAKHTPGREFSLRRKGDLSFRGDAKHRTRNLEIPRCAIAHLRFASRPGMTRLAGHFLLSSIGSTFSGVA